MDQYESRIEELKSRINDNNAELKQIYHAVAETVVAKALADSKEKDLKGLLDKVAELDTRLSDIDSRMDDLRSSYNRISEIADREKVIGEEYSQLEKENKKLLVPIGRAVYARLKDNPEKEYGKVLDSINEGEEKFKELETEIFRIESSGGEKGLFGGLKTRGRSVLLKSRKKRSLSALDSLYGKLGEKVYKKDISFFDHLEGDSLSTFLRNRKKLEKLDGEVAGLKEENAELEKHLKSSFSSSRRNKSEEKLQSERDMILSDKMAALFELGSFLYGKGMHFDNNELKKLFKSADDLKESSESIKSEIDRCKAEIEIGNLEEEVSEMKKSIKELEISIEKSNSDISEFNKEIKRARAEIRKLKKLTGDSNTESDDNES